MYSFAHLHVTVVFSITIDWVTLVAVPGFTAKNMAPTGSSRLVEIPALTTFDIDRSLCPVQAVHLYLLCVSALSGSWLRLFLNQDPLANKEIHADCITKWVRSVVSDAYASVKGVALPEGAICLHEMCALASSWQVFSHSCLIAASMAAGFWHSSCTFTTFYLRHLSANTFNL